MHARAIVLQYRQRELIRLCMKHFRRMEQPEIFETLQKITGVVLEDARLTTLYDLLVVKGDYLQAERFISNAVTSEIFDPDEFLRSLCYKKSYRDI